MSQRNAFLVAVLSQMHAPYRWGGKGERDSVTSQRVFDCSGLVTWALREVGGPDWRNTHNTDALLAQCIPVPRVEELLPGDLVLYHGKGAPLDAEHVMVHVGGGVVVGASGGGSTTLTLADAEKSNACVKVFGSLDYRARRMGMRRLPFRS
ncbi:NlpC/P60 family protein [Myxococcus sp. AB025B]|uniref:NlpC/P60 family protein n=1 Tax=Myxococcus sp. AB025B TaxID=2562794 RepID=UPI0011445DE6|nr:NlpC/P60 family protein [Myxococcus sp. AB025B]